MRHEANQLVLGESLELALNVSRSLAGLEAKVSMAWHAELAVRPGDTTIEEAASGKQKCKEIN